MSRKGPCLSLPHYSCSTGLGLPIIKSWAVRAARGLSDPLVRLPRRRIKGAASWRTRHTDRVLYNSEEKETGLIRNAERETMAQTPAFEVPKQLFNGRALFLAQLS